MRGTKRPRQIELTEADRYAMKESHMLALALTKPRTLQKTQGTRLAQCNMNIDY